MPVQVLDHNLRRMLNHDHTPALSGIYLLKAGDTATGTIFFPVTAAQGNVFINSINSGTLFIDWVRINKTGSNLTDLATRNHNDLQNIQGGSVGNYYHLSSSGLTDAGSFKRYFMFMGA